MFIFPRVDISPQDSKIVITVSGSFLCVLEIIPLTCFLTFLKPLTLTSLQMSGHACVCACVCPCVRACVRTCVCVYVRERACVRVSRGPSHPSTTIGIYLVFLRAGPGTLFSPLALPLLNTRRLPQGEDPEAGLQ